MVAKAGVVSSARFVRLVLLADDAEAQHDGEGVLAPRQAVLIVP
jgi:hypothetical protein